MTPTTKPVVRRSNDRLTRFSRRDIVVIVGPGNMIGFREHGCRTVYTTTIGACASLAVKQTVALDKAMKAAARKAKRSTS